MGRYYTDEPGSKRDWQDRLAKAGKKRAERTRCKACGRGNGYGRRYVWPEGGGSARRCRYCGHEHVWLSTQ